MYRETAVRPGLLLLPGGRGELRSEEEVVAPTVTPRHHTHTYQYRPALHPLCGHSCSGPRGFGDSPGGPPLLLHTRHRPSTRVPHQFRIWHLQGRPALPHILAPYRPLLRLGGPIHHRRQYPNVHRARLPGGRHIHGDLRPDAAALGGGVQTGKTGDRKRLMSAWRGTFLFVHLGKLKPRKRRGLRFACRLANLEKKTAIPLVLIEEGSRRGGGQP